MATPKFKTPSQIVLDAAGAGTAVITARSPLVVVHTRVSVAPAPGKTSVVNIPEAITYLDSDPFESTALGHSDASDTIYEMDGQDVLECRWTGGDPGAIATLIIRGKYKEGP